MHYNSYWIHISLFQPDTSGTIVIRTKYHKLEIDVKHSLEFYETKFLTWKESHPRATIIGCWIPIRFKCAGFRINLFKYSEPVYRRYSNEL